MTHRFEKEETINILVGIMNKFLKLEIKKVLVIKMFIYSDFTKDDDKERRFVVQWL